MPLVSTSSILVSKYIRALLIVLLTALLLHWGRLLFIPLSFALLTSFALYPVCVWLEKKGASRVAAIAVCVGALMIVVTGLFMLLTRQIARFIVQWPQFLDRLNQSLDKFSNFLRGSLGISFEQQQDMVSQAMNDAVSYLVPVLRQSLYISVMSMVLAVLLPIYVALMLYHRHRLVYFLLALFPDSERIRIRKILHDSVFTFYNFLKGMALVYLLVAVLNSIGLLLLGIPHAILFGTIASVLTFIPYVGITVGALLPMAVAWTSFESIWYPVGVVLVFAFVQYLEANIIFPFAVSARLQVNTLFTLIAIVAGGIIWGASGMILFIPFLGILKLVSDRYSKLHSLSVLLGTGNNTRKEEEKPPAAEDEHTT